MITVIGHDLGEISGAMKKRTAGYRITNNEGRSKQKKTFDFIIRNSLFDIRHSPFLFSFVIESLLLVVFFCGEALGVPSFEAVRTSHRKSDSLLLDRHGEVIHELRTNPDGRRLDWVPLQDISPAMQEAVIQAEDRRFYHHGGVNYLAMTGALLRGMVSASFRGASTITMQLASLLDHKLLPVKGKRSLPQKWKQMKAAFDLEGTWSKQEILEAYLNLVTYRGELQGIAAASGALFGKQAHGLFQAESLILSSLIRAPNAPFGEVKRRSLLLSEALHWPVGVEELDLGLRKIYLGSSSVEPRTALAPHVARQLLDGKFEGGAVSCTIDAQTQRFALERLKHYLSVLKTQNVHEGAVLVAENRTGDILAYVSCSEQAPYVDGVRARRQAGSSLKPFLYALAFDERMLTPASMLDDSPVDIAVPNGLYSPGNYDHQFRGRVSAREALASSLNVPAVRALCLVGVDPFLAKLRELRIKGLKEAGDFYGPSLALGTADVSLLDLVSAYMTLANGGVKQELHLSRNYDADEKTDRVFSREAAFLVSDILSDREARSFTFGLENPLATRTWSAVKTGTSKDMRDNWCVGYSGAYTVGVWFGNFSGQPMWDVSGITGAAQVWAEVMNRVNAGDKSLKPEPPPGIARQGIGNPESQREEWFIQGTEPSATLELAGRPLQRIQYPASGTVITLDPDIPESQQRVLFSAHERAKDHRWVLNGKTLGSAAASVAWKPEKGNYQLALVDGKGKVLDSVSFEVRGTEPPRSY
jgi:penicillin-binding protein 1C